MRKAMFSILPVAGFLTGCVVFAGPKKPDPLVGWGGVWVGEYQSEGGNVGTLEFEFSVDTAGRPLGIARFDTEGGPQEVRLTEPVLTPDSIKDRHGVRRPLLRAARCAYTAGRRGSLRSLAREPRRDPGLRYLARNRATTRRCRSPLQGSSSPSDAAARFSPTDRTTRAAGRGRLTPSRELDSHAARGGTSPASPCHRAP